MQRKTLNMYCSRDDTLSQTHCVKKYYQSKIIKDCDKLTNPEEIKKNRISHWVYLQLSSNPWLLRKLTLLLEDSASHTTKKNQ
jgi:hypothetical protein